MVIIEKWDIKMTRGDAVPFIFSAYRDEDMEEIYELNPGDKIVFQLCKKPGVPVITKEKIKENSEPTTPEDYIIKFVSSDTKDLQFGDYFYDVAIHFNEAEAEPWTYIGDKGLGMPKFTLLKEAGGEDE